MPDAAANTDGFYIYFKTNPLEYTLSIYFPTGSIFILANSIFFFNFTEISNILSEIPRHYAIYHPVNSFLSEAHDRFPQEKSKKLRLISKLREIQGMYARMKRVTDPLDERVKARIVGRDGFDPGYVSSGSEHSAHDGDDVISPTLSDLFFCFNGDAGDSIPEGTEVSEDDAERGPSVSDSNEVNVDLIEPILRDQRDLFQELLLGHVMRGLQVFACVKSSKQTTRRNVMAFLRNFGYNVAICKTKWESSGGLTAGNHEFVDVIQPEQNTRYFIELDFASEFEIARPTESYERLLKCLPEVFVGTSDILKRILKIMSDGAKRSLKCRGLLLPPWRKHRFMQKKWLGPYRRTTNIFPASFSTASPVNQRNSVKCRAVGFDSGVNGGGVLLPATARTR